MKKILSALMLCLVSIGFVGCSDKNAPNDPTQTNQTTQATQTETGSTLSTEKNNCLVVIQSDGTSISYLRLKSLVIKDEDGKQVGSGNYWASYYVPYDGTLTMTWEIDPSYSIYRPNYKGAKEVTYTFSVASAHTLDVIIGLDDTDSNYADTFVKIGGSIVQQWSYKDL